MIYKKSIYYFTPFFQKNIPKSAIFPIEACLFKLCRGEISNAHCSIKSTWTYTY